MRLEGTFPALVTPFLDGALDLPALQRQVAFVLDNGVAGLVACGTTGEAPTLSAEEWDTVVATAVAGARGKPVIAGTGANNTPAVIARTQRARELGASAALVVSPYYNKPSPAGLIAHFTKVADEGGLPVVLYNVPGRTGSNMGVDVVASLSRHPQIIGIKDAAGSVDQFGELIHRCGPDFAVLSGDDSLSLPLYALGGKGVITTTGNVAPKAMSQIYKAFVAGDIAQARALHYRLSPLFQALFCEVNPGPVKYALHRMGRMRNELRLPLVPITASSEEKVDAALRLAGIATED